MTTPSITAVLIKTETKSIELVQLSSVDTCNSIYKFLNIHNGSRLMQPVPLDEDNQLNQYEVEMPEELTPPTTHNEYTLMVDEEGIIRPETRNLGFFKIKGYPETLAGRGLIIAEDFETEEFVSTILDIEKLKEAITFI